MSSSLSDRLLEIDNRLQQLAEEKESLLNEARTLSGFLDLLEQLNESQLQVLAKTLTSRVQLTVAMWRFTRNKVITEGFHNKMEMLSRRAYGFRNFENYRIRVMTHCG